MESFLASIYEEGQAFSWLELIAVIFALIYVGLATKSNRWCFLFGLLSSLVYIYLSSVLKFYFDTAINSYYVLMSFYGWFAWSTKTKQNEVKITSLAIKKLLWLIGIGLIISLLLAFFVDRFSDPNLPYLDAFTTVFALIATWMVVKRIIENWLIWIVVDCIASGMYFYKELYLTSVLFIVYTIIAVFGYYNWRRRLA